MFYLSKNKDNLMKNKRKSFLVVKPIEIDGNFNNLVNQTTSNNNYNNSPKTNLNIMQEGKVSTQELQITDNRQFKLTSITPLRVSLNVSTLNNNNSAGVNRNLLFSTTRILNIPNLSSLKKTKKLERDTKNVVIKTNKELTLLTIPRILINRSLSTTLSNKNNKHTSKRRSNRKEYVKNDSNKYCSNENKINIEKNAESNDLSNILYSDNDFNKFTRSQVEDYANYLKDKQIIDFDFFSHQIENFKPYKLHKNFILDKSTKKTISINTNSRRKRAISTTPRPQRIIPGRKKKVLNKNHSKSKPNKFTETESSKKIDFLKKKKKHSSNLFDIDNFVLHVSAKVRENKDKLNIPVPKFTLLSRDFFETTTNTVENEPHKELNPIINNTKKSNEQQLSFKNNLTYQCINQILAMNDSLEDSNKIDSDSNHGSFKPKLIFNSNFITNEELNPSKTSSNNLTLKEFTDTDLKNNLTTTQCNVQEIKLENKNSNVLQSPIRNALSNHIDDTSDEFYNLLHQEYEERERRFKQNYYAQKKKNHKENDNAPIIPCQFDFEAYDEDVIKENKLGKHEKINLVK